MKISENDIASTEPFGMLDGKQVNLIKTRGGLNLATLDDKVLGAASHQAILCYSIEQKFPSFQPMIMKSESLKLEAEKHSHFLTDDLRKSGHDIYSVQNGTEVEFFVTKQDVKVGNAVSSIQGDSLVVSSLNVPKECIHAMSGAVSEKALGQGIKKVRIA
jgi:hypothetical protein